MRALRFLIVKEFLQIFRNKTILKLILLMPVVQILLLPWAASFEQKNISLGVIDQDHSAFSSELVNKLLSSGYFSLHHYSDSHTKGLGAIEKNEVDLILEIPLGFERDLIREKRGSLMMTVDAINGQKAALGSSYLGQIIADYNIELVKKIPSPQVEGRVEIEPYYQFNTTMSYKPFMVPGVLVLLLSLIGGMLSSLNIVKEKEQGTIEQINVSPLSRGVFILAKVIPFWVIGIGILSMGIFLIWLVYGIFPLGALHVIYLFSFIYLVAFAGLGLIISNYSTTQQQAMFLGFFFLMIFFLLSGLFTPISSMPDWAQVVTCLNPVRYFIETVRFVYMKGAGLADLWSQMLIISIFALVLNGWAVLSYRKSKS